MEKFEKRVWLSTPTVHSDDMVYVKEAFDTGWVSTVGENINTVEQLFSARVGCRHAVALSCGTAALHLAVKLAGVRAGDVVLCSDMTFAATVNPVCYEGATPVFVDSEYDTWNMDPDALERAFEAYPTARAVVVANLYGTPAKLDRICAIAARHGAVVIEDAAESLGATYRGLATGTFGDYNVISFNGNKIITGSSGGMLLTDDGEAAARARKWSTQSRDAAPWYQHTELGYNYRMSNIVAGVVRAQAAHLDEHIAGKRAVYERYKAGLADLPVSMNPYDAETMTPNFWLSCLLVDECGMCRQERDDHKASYTPAKGRSCPTEILETLAAYNAEGRPIWKPMHMQPIFAKSPFFTKEGLWKAGDTAVDEDIFRRGLCLPSDNKMTPDEQARVIEIVRGCFE